MLFHQGDIAMRHSSIAAASLVMILACSLADRSAPAQEPTRHSLMPTPENVAWGYYWSEAKPVLRVKSGDIVEMRTLLTNSPQGLERMGAAPEEVEQYLRDVYERVPREARGPGGHILTGPVYVEGAAVGDVLEVRILSAEPTIPYGYNGASGFLREDFRRAGSRLIRMDLERRVALFAEGIEIPLAPFFGCMGVAPPPEAGRWSSVPPWIHGGNLDNRHLVAGTTLYLPVWVEGALFEAGDGHAVQGDGEVDQTALETSLQGEFQLIVRKDMGPLAWPRAETPTHYITMGTDEDLLVATKTALREMIDFLEKVKGLDRVEAYRLCSLAVDMHITQLVDQKVGVHAMCPKGIFQ
jgi:acetamidase/formamidase